MKISKKVFSLTGLLVAATLLLGACGEEVATATPSSTNPTAAPSALATTGGTTGAATTGATVNGIPDATVLPAIPGTTEVKVDSTIQTEVAKQLGVPTLAVKLLTSDDDVTKLGNATDAALTATGYAFGIPGLAKPLSQNGGTVGLYSKAGSSDILFTAVPIPDNTVDVGKSIPGIDAASAQKFADQIKGKKTLLIVMTGPNLLQALVQLGQSGTGTITGTPGAVTGATPTVASATLPSGTTAARAVTTVGAATTAAPTNSGATTTSVAGPATSVRAVSGTAVIAYAGATGITLPDVLQSTLLSSLSAAKNAKLEGFKSGDAPARVKTGLMNSYNQTGWTDATASFAGASVALNQLGPDSFFFAYTKDNKLSFVLGLSGYTAGLLGVSGADASGTVYMVGSGEKP